MPTSSLEYTGVLHFVDVSEELAARYHERSQAAFALVGLAHHNVPRKPVYLRPSRRPAMRLPLSSAYIRRFCFAFIAVLTLYASTNQGAA